MLKRQAQLSRAPPMLIKRTKDGLDFHFAKRQHAQKLVSLLHGLAPCRSKSSSSVVASNAKLGTSNVKHTWSVEVAPICRGDLVCIPRAIAGGGSAGGGSAGRWALVTAVGGSIRLIDPTCGKVIEVSAEGYWRHPFTAVASRKQLGTFVVLDMEIDDRDPSTASKSADPSTASASSAEQQAEFPIASDVL